MVSHLRLAAVIFICSLSALAYEIALTRIFSITLSYHFAFFIVSTAMLGIGMGGTMLFAFPKLNDKTKIGAYSFFLGAGILFSYITMNRIPFDPVTLFWSKAAILNIGIYCVILSIPFFFAGLIIGSSLSAFPAISGILYGADLLGAGSGALLILSLMGIYDLDICIIIISLVPLTAAVFFSQWKVKIISLIFILLAGMFIYLYPESLKIRMSPYKELPRALHYPGAELLRTYISPYTRIDTFRSPATRFAPGLSLRYLNPLPDQVGFSIDGGETNAITAAGDKASLLFLRYLPSALPYELKSNLIVHGKSTNILILDPKGGLQALVAEYYAMGSIQKIESNPLLIDIVKRDFNSFSGGVYAFNTIEGIGRSWLKKSKQQFNIIDISMTGTSPSGSFGILEDYRFTTDAFKEYISHLEEDGLLSIHLFILPPPRTELRLLLTGIAAMEEAGIRNIEQHIAAIRSIETLCILLKKSPFDSADIRKIRQFAEERRFDLVYYPGITGNESNRFIRMPSNEYSDAFRQLLNKDSRAGFIRSYLFDIEPVDDESPFFHSYLKMGSIREIHAVMGKKWQYFVEEGYILPIVFVQIVTASIFLILLPLFIRRKSYNGIGSTTNRFFFLSYFAFIGIGFMFIEVPLIQKMILPFGNPSYAFAAVLTSILISSGAGSVASHSMRQLRTPFVLCIISFVIIILSFMVPVISAFISLQSLSLRVFMTFLFFFPTGFLMGIPFPLGLTVLGDHLKTLIPWAWAINGCFSVLAPILAMMTAMIAGYTVVLWLAALCYLLAFLSFISCSRSLLSSARMQPGSAVRHQDHPSSL
jgi:hypothetical protein